MKKRLTALILSGVLMLTCLGGCGNSDVRDVTDTATPTDADASPSPTAEMKDYDYALEKYNVDDVVMTVNGLDVTWGEYFYWLVYSITMVENYYGEITDWNAACAFDETMTYKDYVQQAATDAVVQYRAMEYNAQAMDVTLDEEDQAALDEIWNQSRDTYAEGDDAAFEEYLASIYLDKDLFYYMNGITQLYTKVFEKQYGVGGENLSDEDTDAYVQAAGYMRAKHILLSTKAEDGTTDLSEEEKAEKKATAEEVFSQLKACTDTESLLTKFDELSAEYNEDPGASSYPDGYTFVEGSMVQEFYDAAASLGENQMYDGIVESDYGYHIILRLPLDYDMVIDPSYGDTYTLRYMAAVDQYESMVQGWMDDAEITYTDLYNNLDLSVVFENGQEETDAEATDAATENTDSADAEDGSDTADTGDTAGDEAASTSETPTEE
jgi:hypothetical protein